MIEKKLKIASYIKEIVHKLQLHGYESYIVGGAVRDLLLDRVPKDYDISTSATPEQIKAVFGRRHARIIGRRFQLVHLRHGKEIIEISTFRRKPADGQKEVKVRENTPGNLILNDNDFGNSVEDAWRRDFTVNALFYDPVNKELIDHVGAGIDDINKKIIRVIGEPRLRFEEDPVRILRALKFAGQCGFSFDPATEKALKEDMHLITHASQSRLTLELEKILSNPYGDKILEKFHQYGLLYYFMPFLDNNWDTVAGKYARELYAERNFRVGSGVYRNSVSLAIASLALPFIEDEFGTGEPGTLWRNSEEIPSLIRKHISRIFTPHGLIKRVCVSSLRMLLMQPKLKYGRLTKRMYYSAGYSHARELLLIQNNVSWGDDELEAKLLPPVKSGRRKRGSHQRRRQRPNKGGRKPAAVKQGKKS